MGFRTLAIEKRTSEVWNLLAGLKTEWTKYGEVLDTAKKKLNQASDAIGKATSQVAWDRQEAERRSGTPGIGGHGLAHADPVG